VTTRMERMSANTCVRRIVTLTDDSRDATRRRQSLNGAAAKKQKASTDGAFSVSAPDRLRNDGILGRRAGDRLRRQPFSTYSDFLHAVKVSRWHTRETALLSLI
jgi:hypothetical protein